MSLAKRRVVSALGLYLFIYRLKQRITDPYRNLDLDSYLDPCVGFGFAAALGFSLGLVLALLLMRN